MYGISPINSAFSPELTFLNQNLNYFIPKKVILCPGKVIIYVWLYFTGENVRIRKETNE